MKQTTAGQTTSYHDSLREKDPFPAHIAVLDRRGNIIATNESLPKSTLENSTSLRHFKVGINYLDTCFKLSGKALPIDMEKAVHGIQMVLNNKKDDFKIEYLCSLSGREKYLLIQAAAIHFKDARAIVTHTDITRYKQAKKTEKRLLQNRKMPAIGTLASGVAHELNNTLAGILGYTELIFEDLEGTKCPFETYERLENVITSANRAREMIRQISNFSHSEKKDPLPSEKEIIGGNESILYVDDEKILGEIIKQSLSNLGYRVVSFDRSLDALLSFEKNPDLYDLVISDLTMPDIPGDILVTKMRLVKPGLPVILCTGAGGRMDELTAKKSNINGFLYKPISIEKFDLTIRNVLKGKTAWEKF